MTYEDRRWHVPEDDLRAYARGGLEAPALWSADTHLTACAHCRAVLAGLGDTVALDDGWERLDAELDAPRPGLLESLLLRLGVRDHTARLLAATPALRRSWLGAVSAVLLLTVAVTAGRRPPSSSRSPCCCRSRGWRCRTGRGWTRRTKWPWSRPCTGSGC